MARRSHPMDIPEAFSHLPEFVVRHTLATLAAALPPPVPDSPAARATSEWLAVAALIPVRPADAFEISHAAVLIAADAHAMECLRLAVQPGLDIQMVRRYQSQAASLMNVTRSGLKLLEGIQAKRRKVAAAAARPAPRSPGVPPGPTRAGLRLVH